MKNRQFILIFLLLLIMCGVLIDIDDRLSTSNTRLWKIYDTTDAMSKDVNYMYRAFPY